MRSMTGEGRLTHSRDTPCSDKVPSPSLRCGLGSSRPLGPMFEMRPENFWKLIRPPEAHFARRGPTGTTVSLLL
jgi:hypothetical protein